MYLASFPRLFFHVCVCTKAWTPQLNPFPHQISRGWAEPCLALIFFALLLFAHGDAHLDTKTALTSSQHRGQGGALGEIHGFVQYSFRDGVKQKIKPVCVKVCDKT